MVLGETFSLPTGATVVPPREDGKHTKYYESVGTAFYNLCGFTRKCENTQYYCNKFLCL
jgi:hypothetical protein